MLFTLSKYKLIDSSKYSFKIFLLKKNPFENYFIKKLSFKNLFLQINILLMFFDRSTEVNSLYVFLKRLLVLVVRQREKIKSQSLKHSKKLMSNCCLVFIFDCKRILTMLYSSDYQYFFIVRVDDDNISGAAKYFQ